jgi:hypothetical protein
MIADELRRQSDTFLELHELAPFIQREHRAAVAVADSGGEGDGNADDEERQRPLPRSSRFYQQA